MSAAGAVRLAMAPRKAGFTPAEAQRHWREAHADTAALIPGLRRYVQHHAVLIDGQPVLPYPGFDACAELAFDSVEAHDAGFGSAHYRGAVRADEDRFVDKTSFSWALCEPSTLLDRSDGHTLEDPVTLLWLWRAHPVGGRDALEAGVVAWADAIVADTTVLRLDRLLVRHDWHEGRPPPACDAAAVLTFDGLDAARGHLAGIAQHAALALAGRAFGAAGHLACPRPIVPAPPGAIVRAPPGAVG